MGDFNLKTWAKKWVYGFGAVVATAAVVYTTDYLQATTFPPQYAFWGGLITVLVVQLGNAIKHLK
jgi:hypothetical protein